MIAGQPPALMNKTVPVPIIRHIVFHIPLMSVPDLHIPRVIRMVRNEVRNIKQVALVHCVVLLDKSKQYSDEWLR